MALAFLIVTLAVAVATSLSPEATLPFAALVTWFSDHQSMTLFGSSATVFLMTRYVSQALER